MSWTGIYPPPAHCARRPPTGAHASRWLPRDRDGRPGKRRDEGSSRSRHQAEAGRAASGEGGDRSEALRNLFCLCSPALAPLASMPSHASHAIIRAGRPAGRAGGTELGRSPLAGARLNDSIRLLYASASFSPACCNATQSQGYMNLPFVSQ